MIKNTSVLSIPLGMANSYLLQGTKCVLVDTGNPGNEKKLLSILANNNVNPKDISLILITHGHSDHFGGIELIKNITGAKVAIHKLDAESIRNGKNPPLLSTNFAGKLLSTFIRDEIPGFHGFEPDILIDQELFLQDFGVAARVIFTPGHTMGSVSVMMNSGECIVGDLISGGLVRKNKPQYSWFGNDFEQMRNSMRSVMQLSPRIVYAGHGGPFFPDVIKKNISF